MFSNFRCIRLYLRAKLNFDVNDYWLINSISIKILYCVVIINNTQIQIIQGVLLKDESYYSCTYTQPTPPFVKVQVKFYE